MKQEPVKTEDGRSMAEKINAFGYLECSARTKEGVREVFELATRAALQVNKILRVSFLEPLLCAVLVLMNEACCCIWMNEQIASIMENKVSVLDMHLYTIIRTLQPGRRSDVTKKSSSYVVFLWYTGRNNSVSFCKFEKKVATVIVERLLNFCSELQTRIRLSDTVAYKI